MLGWGRRWVEAYVRALEADPVSAFGGVVGVNRTVDEAAATEIAKLFVEAIVAPTFTVEALAILAAKKNLRVLKIQPSGGGDGGETDFSVGSWCRMRIMRW